jgi:fermentation-respiration switch protein FrsA (DUF1100 family)
LRVPRAAWVALLVPLLGYGGFVGALAWIENRLVFPVAPWTRHLTQPDPRLGLRPERVTMATSDGVRLVGWQMGADSSAPWVLIFHGNAGNIGDGGRPEHYARLRALGLNVLTFDYRGYGESEGAPTEAGVYRDAQAALAFLRDSLHVPPERTILFGHSLGSAVAVDLASRVSAAGLILDGSFTSAPDAAGYAYPFVPVRLIMRNRFASDEKIARATMPKLFLHGEWDRVIPIGLGRRLYQLAGGAKTFVQLNGGHDDSFILDSAGYFGAISAFLAGYERDRR